MTHHHELTPMRQWRKTQDAKEDKGDKSTMHACIVPACYSW